MGTSSEIRQTIGNKLREVRKRRGETQQQVAESFGLSRQMVNRYEKGRDGPRGENLLKVLRYVGNSVDLPAYAYTITAQALETPPRGPRAVERQLTLELDKPYEVPKATVRIVPREGSIEIVISGTAVGGLRR